MPCTASRGLAGTLLFTLADDECRSELLRLMGVPGHPGIYVLVLHSYGDKVSREQKLLLAAFGLTLARVQGLRPTVGLVARGPEARLGKIRLDPKLYRRAQQVLRELGRLQAGGEFPRLTLNGHCEVCEFRLRKQRTRGLTDGGSR